KNDGGEFQISNHIDDACVVEISPVRKAPECEQIGHDRASRVQIHGIVLRKDRTAPRIEPACERCQEPQLFGMTLAACFEELPEAGHLADLASESSGGGYD